MKSFVKGFLVTFGVLAAIMVVAYLNNPVFKLMALGFCTSEIGKIILFCLGIIILVSILIAFEKGSNNKIKDFVDLLSSEEITELKELLNKKENK